jgi:hypothetical protein
MSENPPQRRSSSAARREFLRFAGRTRTGPSCQNSPEIVPSPSIHAARSPVDATVRHADLRIAVAPPWGSQTESLPLGRPPLGRIPSSGGIPVATGSAVRCVTGVASGNRCSSRALRRAVEEDTLIVYPEQIPKTRTFYRRSPSLASRRDRLLYPKQHPRQSGTGLHGFGRINDATTMLFFVERQRTSFCGFYPFQPAAFRA